MNEYLIKLVGICLKNSIDFTLEYEEADHLSFEAYGITDSAEEIYLTIKNILEEMNLPFERDEDLMLTSYISDDFDFEIYLYD